jgi:Uncharacterised nucleotidyltransferase
MRSTGFRFHPPPIEFTPEVRWALLRAFGPPDRVFSGPLDAEAAICAAGSLDLGPRIGGRVALATLKSDLGEEAGRSLLIDNVKAAWVASEHLKCALVVAEAAAEIGVPVTFLKGVALQLSGVSAEGARWLSDVDVLAPAGRASTLVEALVRRGFRPAEFRPEAQHLPPLRRGRTELVEVHRLLLGVSPSKSRGFATLDGLLECGLLERLPEGMPGECFVPGRELLAAHALAHGLAQHGLAPATYPMTRMLADLVDLGLAAPDGERLAGALFPMIAGEVSREELDATRALCVVLSDGDEDVFAPLHAGREALLLRHAVAGLTDDAYRTAIRLSGLWSAPSEHPMPIALLVEVYRALFLTRAQIDMVYGPPRSAWGYLGWRLLRPFDLVRRLVRYRASAAGLRQRR